MFTVDDADKFNIETIWDLYRRHVNASQVELIGAFPFGREIVKEAQGCWIYLHNGRRIFDATGGIGVLNHGHNHPKILSARKLFAERNKMEVHKNYFNPYVAALGSNLSEILPGELNYSYFPNSGAEAVEGAVKIAYKYHRGLRNRILRSNIAFHGKLLGAGSLTNSPEISFKFPEIPGIDTFVYNDIDSVKQLIENNKVSGVSDHYALIIEPLNASSMLECTEEFLWELKDLTKKENILLIFDEVYTGWGKTGYLFNFMRIPDLVPDILVYAKSFGGGKSSISGYSYTNEVAKSYDSLRDATLHSSTYYGFGEEVVTALTAINILIDEKLVENSEKIGLFAKPRFDQIAKKSNLITEVRGSGSLWGFILDSNVFEVAVKVLRKLNIMEDIFADERIAKKILCGAIVNHLYENHGVLTYFGVNIDNPLIVSFPLIATEEEVCIVADALEKTFSVSLSFLLTSFIKSKVRGPKTHVK